MSVDDVVKAAVARNNLVDIAPSEAFRAAIPVLQGTIRRGLGEATVHRRMSSAIIKADPVFIACTLLDPELKNLDWRHQSHPITAGTRMEARAFIAKLALAHATSVFHVFYCSLLPECSSGLLLLHAEPTRIQHVGLSPPRKSQGPTQPAGQYIADSYINDSDDSNHGLSSASDDTVMAPPEESEVARLSVLIEAEIAHELDRFLSPSWAAQKHQDPLAWWRVEGAAAYPRLAPVARRMFSILASSAVVERAFKCAKLLSRDERGRISDHHLDMMTVLSYTIKKDPDIVRRWLRGAVLV
jgi:hAT family C-terminal dimerisation region